MTAIPGQQALISTIKEQCRVCYTCVRECPAKAIRISSGQAEVIIDRCIGCGNCFRVCSQHAKRVFSSIDHVEELLRSSSNVAACLAPSFPAHFGDLDYRIVVGMVRKLGFEAVYEVGFGADLVAERYRKLLGEHPESRYIGANCPAVVEFILRFHPGLVDSIAPIVSPMLAMARVIRHIRGPEVKVVFIGPCIAKKAERDQAVLMPEIDSVLTFIEFEQMIEQHGIAPASVPLSEFDEPTALVGGLFPISRGMLQVADIAEDLLAGEVVAADGRKDFIEAIKEFESGALDARLLEVLCCSGCIMGPGIDSDLPLFSRRSLVSGYVRKRTASTDPAEWRSWMDVYRRIDLNRTFVARKLNVREPSEESIGRVLARMGKFQPKDELNCGACGYDSCREHARAIELGLAESEMCLPYTIEQLRKTLKELALSKEELATLHAALVQSEKLASMGQLAAAVAHEINNPLGVVLMYAHLLYDESRNDSKLSDDLKMIAEQTERCKKIVAGLLDFARQNKVVRQPTDVNELLHRCMRIMPPPDTVTVVVRTEAEDPMAELDPDQINQILINLVNNGYEAMPNGGTLTVGTHGDEHFVRFVVSDTGMGISEQNLNKVFEPFFTTKQLSKGTGLGLAVTYGIVKMHRGDIQIESNADPSRGPTGATFRVILPRTDIKE